MNSQLIEIPKNAHTIVQVLVKDLIPADYNPRKFSDVQIKNLKEGIGKFGFVDPIIVNSAPERKNIVIGGHFRLKVAKDLGIESVPVVYVEIADIKKEKELNLRLNKNLGEWDFDILSSFDIDLLKLAGFDGKDLDVITGGTFEKDEDDVPDVTDVPRAKPGDIFHLGSHRVMCGDSTKKEDLLRLMHFHGGAHIVADMVFTDPPYNVSYVGKTKNELKIRNDQMSAEEFNSFLSATILNIFQFCKGSIYVCMSSSEWPTLHRIFKELGGHWSSTIIWVKDRSVLSHADYHNQFEPIAVFNEPENEEGIPILYGWKEGEKRFWNGDRKKTDIWNVKRPNANKEHPTMKPVELCSKAILNSSPRGGIVLDLFLGSGSTLIACDKNERICYGMELDPKYVDVIVNRWEQFSGKKAKLL